MLIEGETLLQIINGRLVRNPKASTEQILHALKITGFGDFRPKFKLVQGMRAIVRQDLVFPNHGNPPEGSDSYAWVVKELPGGKTCGIRTMTDVGTVAVVRKSTKLVITSDGEFIVFTTPSGNEIHFSCYTEYRGGQRQAEATSDELLDYFGIEMLGPKSPARPRKLKPVVID